MDSWGGGLYLVALSGWGQEENKVRAKAAGFDQHLTKPIDHDVLESLLSIPIRKNQPDPKRENLQPDKGG